MTSALASKSIKRLAFKRLFKDQPEDSLRLRFLILLTVLWVALSVSWVTGSSTIPIATAAAAIVGHWISWRWRQSPMTLRSILIVVALVGLSIFLRDDFISSLTGDRLPIAEYLLLVNGLASFGIKTRGGLYAQLTLSGLVLFFVSERAFDQTFVGFLIVFLGLFLTFFAMAFIEDQIRIARVHWPERQLGRFWFWLGIVGGGLLVFSALAYSLLPPDYRGGPGSQRTGVMPFFGEADAFGGVPQPQPADTPGPQDDGESQATQAAEEPQEGDQGLGGIGAGAPQGFKGRQVAADPRDLVMHVRSGVTSYWRGRIFSTFDGQTWYRSTGSILQRARLRDENYYWQAYFMERDEPQSLFVGYNALRVLVPDEIRNLGSLTGGTTYSVLSQQPNLTARSVTFDRPGTPGRRYFDLPAAYEDLIREVSSEVVGDELTPFQRIWLIVTHMRQNHQYNPSGPDQLRLSGSLDDFLTVGSTGSSLDFATATVLLARAAGLPARLAVGYLPGRFDPFSGTHKVRTKDLHAWAEINFARNGWVAFDGTPRPELRVFTTGNLQGFEGTTYIFQTRIGGGLYRAMRSSASQATDSIAEALEGRSGTVRLVAGIIVGVLLVAAISWLAVWYIRRRKTRGGQGWGYSRLSGDTRAEVMRAYKGMERHLQRHGHAPRGASQTFEEYAESAARWVGRAASDLAWFTNAARVAAYDPVGPSAQMADEASERLSRLRRRRALSDEA